MEASGCSDGAVGYSAPLAPSVDFERFIILFRVTDLIPEARA